MTTLCLSSKKNSNKTKHKKKPCKKIRILIFRILPTAVLIIQVI